MLRQVDGSALLVESVALWGLPGPDKTERATASPCHEEMLASGGSEKRKFGEKKKTIMLQCIDYVGTR